MPSSSTPGSTTSHPVQTPSSEERRRAFRPSDGSSSSIFDLVGGTGWLIDGSGPDRIIVTNRHVASLVAKRTVDGRGMFMRDPFQAKLGAYIDFKEEVRSQPGRASSFEVLDIPYLADTTAPDVALMRITGHDLPSVLPLAEPISGDDSKAARAVTPLNAPPLDVGHASIPVGIDGGRPAPRARPRRWSGDSERDGRRGSP